MSFLQSFSYNMVLTPQFLYPGHSNRSLPQIFIKCIFQPIFTQYDIYTPIKIQTDLCLKSPYVPISIQYDIYTLNSVPWFLHRQTFALISFLCLLLYDTGYCL